MRVLSPLILFLLVASTVGWASLLAWGAQSAEGGPPGVAPAGGSPVVGYRFSSRLISTNLAIDEMLVDLVPASMILGLSVFADDPTLSNVSTSAAAIRGRFRIGTGSNIEPLIAARPTVVLLSPFTLPRARSLLKRAGVRSVEVPAARSFAAIRENLFLLGRLTGYEARAEELVSELDQRVGRVRRLAPSRAGRTVLVYDRGWVAGSGTLLDEVIDLTGAENAAAEIGVEGHAPLDHERLLQLDPDVLVLSFHDVDAKSRELFAPRSPDEQPVLRRLAAVREGRTCSISARFLRSTSHHAVGAAEALARCLDRSPTRAVQ